MPGEGIETQEIRDQMEEAAEHAHGHGEGHGGGGEHEKKPTWTIYLSLSTAIIAVCAAIASLQSGANESSALLERNEAVLLQAKASDQWAFFQAKSTKSAIYEAEKEGADPARADLVEKLEKKIAGYEKEKDAIKEKAEELEKEVLAKGKDSEEFLHKHHRFALAVTIFQVSIALSAIAALTKRQPLWWVSIFVGAGGLVFFVLGIMGM